MNKKIKTINLIFITTLIIVSVGFLYFSSQAEARRGCCSHHGGVCTYECPDGINIGYCCCDGTSLSAKCAPYYSSCPPASKIKPTIPPIKIDYTVLTSTSAEVIRTVDGDTIEIKFPDGTIEKVRLIGIDTPETVDPRKPVECFGKEASAKMKELVNGKTVRLERKPAENRGSYGRLLRYVYIGDFFVNAEMIKQGYAYAYTKYPFDVTLMEQFRQYEKEARENERGLWAPGVCENENQTNKSEQSPNTSSVENQSNETLDTTNLNNEQSESKPPLAKEDKNTTSESDNFIYWLISIPLFGIAVIIFLIYRNGKYEQKN